MNEHAETGTRLHTPEPAFHADDTEQVAGYRTVSALAIVSLLFGLAAPLCLAWPLLLSIPLLGAAISIVAIRRIDVSGGVLAGRWAAMIGLVLCVASGAAAVSQNFVKRTIRTQQAEAVGREWIALLLAGDTDKAFRLTVDGNRREPPMPQPGMPAATETPQELFLEHPVVTELAATGTGADVQLVDTLLYEPQPRRQFMIQQRFLVVPHNAAAATHSHPIEVILTLQRSQLAGERQPRWLAANYQVPHAAHDAAHVH